jgi:hypothetical protein
MGSNYAWGVSPIRDTLLQMIGIGVDISDKKFKRELNEIIRIIVDNYVRDKEDLVYLDFKIKKSEEYYQVIGNNIVSALWLSGIIPKNPQAVMDANKCHIADKIYTFDKKKKILIDTVRK